MATITVYFRPVNIDQTYFHEFFVYVDDSGNSFYIAAGPNSSNVIYAQPSTPYTAAGAQTFNLPDDYAPIGTFHGELVAQGAQASLQPIWDNISAFAQTVDTENIQYSLVGPNCNSFVAAALVNAGLPQLNNNALDGIYAAPGANVPLITSSLPQKTVSALSYIKSAAENYVGDQLLIASNKVEGFIENGTQTFKPYVTQATDYVINGYSALASYVTGNSEADGVTETTNPDGTLTVVVPGNNDPTWTFDSSYNLLSAESPDGSGGYSDDAYDPSNGDLLEALDTSSQADLVTEASVNGNEDVSTDIENGTSIEVTFDQSISGVTQSFAFIGSNSTLQIDAPAQGAPANNYVINSAASGADLTTDTLNFDGNSIAGNVTSGGQDQYGRTYNLSGDTLTITSGSDTLTVGGFQNGDFGLSLGPVFMTINLPSNFGAPSASGINDAGVVVGNEVVNQGNAGAYSAGFIDSSGTVSIVSYGGGSTFVNGISNSGVLALQADYNYAAYGAEENNGAVTILSNGPLYSAQQVVNLTGVNSSGEAVGMYYGDGYGFVYKNGVFTTLIDPSLPSNSLVWPLGVNDAGVIFGWIEAGTGGAFRSGFVDNGGVFTSINDPNAVNGGLTEVTGVNASGEVVGYYIGADNIQHGFIEAGGNFQTVDDPGMTQTVISGVNDSGEITGYAYDTNGTEIAFTATVSVPVCFLTGTHILTPTGEVLVENLKIGDVVVTRFSGIQPIKWIGRQRYDSRFIRTNRAHIPVCIHAGALADHMPARNLYISPGHSMLVNGQLVLAWSLGCVTELLEP